MGRIDADAGWNGEGVAGEQDIVCKGRAALPELDRPNPGRPVAGLPTMLVLGDNGKSGEAGKPY
jgi:hypothetical protein